MKALPRFAPLLTTLLVAAPLLGGCPDDSTSGATNDGGTNANEGGTSSGGDGGANDIDLFAAEVFRGIVDVTVSKTAAPNDVSIRATAAILAVPTTDAEKAAHATEASALRDRLGIGKKGTCAVPPVPPSPGAVKFADVGDVKIQDGAGTDLLTLGRTPGGGHQGGSATHTTAGPLSLRYWVTDPARAESNLGLGSLGEVRFPEVTTTPAADANGRIGLSSGTPLALKLLYDLQDRGSFRALLYSVPPTVRYECFGNDNNEILVSAEIMNQFLSAGSGDREIAIETTIIEAKRTGPSSATSLGGFTSGTDNVIFSTLSTNFGFRFYYF